MEYAVLQWENDNEKKKEFLANLAPIILFTYNRLEHTKQTIEALQKNIYAKESKLYIYSDAAKNNSDKKKVAIVREYLKTIDGFKTVEIIEHGDNLGLAGNIIAGVTVLTEKHGKVIVLEDDVITSRYFLKYMNDALEVYKDYTKVMQINGYWYPIESEGLPGTFFLKLDGSSGWATWKDRWSLFKKEPEKLKKSLSKDEIKKFNLDGNANFWQQVLDNCSGKINTWLIFWYAAIFKNDGLCLHTNVSMSGNIGFDGTGVHCSETSDFDVDLADRPVTKFSLNFIENELAKERLKFFFRGIYKKSIFDRTKLFLKRKLKECLER